MTRENTNNFTREDILRELELLPVWQLRNPDAYVNAPPSSVSTTAPETSNLSQMASEALIVTEAKVEQAVQAISKTTPHFRHVASEDGQWLFILADAEFSIEQQLLLDNIFKAMRLKMKAITASASTAQVIQSTPPKLLVSMGESVTKSLMQNNHALQDWRGRPHEYEGVKLIATYDVEYLLNNITDKAKAWADLCFAMQLVQNLNN